MVIALLLMLLVVCYTGQSLFCTMFSQNYPGDKAAASPVFSVGYGLIVGVCTLAAGGFHYAPSIQTFLLGLATAFMLFVYNFSLIQAGSRGSYSFMMICMLFGGIIPPLIVGTAFLGETMSGLDIAALLLMLASFIVINLRGLHLGGNTRSYYLWCVLLFLSNGIFAILLNLQSTIMHATQRTEMISTAYLGLSVLSFLFLLITRRRTLRRDFTLTRKSALFALASCIVATIAVNMCMVALSMADSYLVYTVDNGGVLVLSIIASRILFREKLAPNQYAGIALALISLVLFSL